MSFWTWNVSHTLPSLLFLSFSHLSRPVWQEIWSVARESQWGGHELHHSCEDSEYACYCSSHIVGVCAVVEDNCDDLWEAEASCSSSGSPQAKVSWTAASDAASSVSDWHSRCICWDLLGQTNITRSREVISEGSQRSHRAEGAKKKQKTMKKIESETFNEVDCDDV